MYRGDGSFKQTQTEFILDTSLIELLYKEKELVDRYNSAVIALETARKNLINTVDYTKDIEKLSEKIGEARTEIRQHCSTKLGIKTNIADMLYGSNN